MKIYGLQKLTLLDYPGKVACTIFTGGCNFRCPFCHNADLVLPGRMPEEIPADKLAAFFKKRTSVLDGVCITGGEPLLWPEIGPFLEQLKALGYSVKLDTNGSFPERLSKLAEAGLIDYVAMDIKNAPDRYAETIGLPSFDITPIRESVAFLLGGTLPYEFRTTVVREFHSEEELIKIGEWIRGAKRYYLQSFLDSGSVIREGLSAYEKEEMERFCTLVRAHVPAAELRGI